jgi:hypothetical protein
MSRAQTTLDFAIGISVFLLAVVFVLGFVPGMVQPFTDSGQEAMASSDRLADRLATDALAGADPHVLDARCTTTFFEQGVAPTGSDDCRFDGSGPEEALAVDDRLSVNVTLTETRNGASPDRPLCWDDDGRTVAVAGAGGAPCDDSGDVVYVAGDRVPDADGVVTATRHVSVEGTHATLVVRVW